MLANPSGCADCGVDLQPLACWDCGFESYRGHGCVFLMIVVCYVEVYATSRSLVQRIPVDCGLSVFSESSAMERPSPTRTLEPRKVKLLLKLNI
jgi:hypothetical protein